MRQSQAAAPTALSPLTPAAQALGETHHFSTGLGVVCHWVRPLGDGRDVARVDLQQGERRGQCGGKAGSQEA
jgi:hypothetical protein